MDPIRADHAAGHHKAGELVAGEKSLIQCGQLGSFRRVKVGHDSLGYCRLVLFPQPRDDQLRMLIGPPVVIGVVQQMSTLVLPYQLQNTAIFVVFLLIIFLRPHGMFGRLSERT